MGFHASGRKRVKTGMRKGKEKGGVGEGTDLNGQGGGARRRLLEGVLPQGQLVCLVKFVKRKNWENPQVTNPKSRSAKGCRSISLRYCLFLERLSLVVNENNGNPTCSLLGSEPIRRVVIIRPNLIGQYLTRTLF